MISGPQCLIWWGRYVHDPEGERSLTRGERSYCKGERVKPWPDWALWLMFVLCLVASIGIALFA